MASQAEQDEEVWSRRNTERNWAVIEVMGQVVDTTGKSYFQIALNWLLGRLELSSVIIGARTL